MRRLRSSLLLGGTLALVFVVELRAEERSQQAVPNLPRPTAAKPIAVPAPLMGAVNPARVRAIARVNQFARKSRRLVEDLEDSRLVPIVAQAEVVCLVEVLSPNGAGNAPRRVWLNANGVVRAVFVRKGRVINGTGKYNIVRAAKCPGNVVRPLDDVEAPVTTAQKGDLCLLVGQRFRGGVDWSAPVPISEDAFDYAVAAPQASAPIAERVAYFSRYLTSSDRQSAGDAALELAAMPYRKLVAAKDYLPQDAQQQCRRLVADVNITENERVAAARLISVFGTPEDGLLLESLAFADGSKAGFAGSALKEFTVAYLLLTGAHGVDKVGEWLRADPSGTQHDDAAILEAILTVAGDLPDRIPRAKLVEPVRLLLERPDRFRFATDILAGWASWTDDERLAHFARYLGSAHPQIAKICLSQLSHFSDRQLAYIAKAVPTPTIEQCRRQLTDRNTPPVDRAIFARLLGAWGSEPDAARFETILSLHTSELRYGTKEFAIAYVFLRGEKGLDKFDELLIKSPEATAQDAHAAFDAIVALGEDIPGKVPRPRLVRSLELFLDWPDQAWRAIRVLARWQDWSVHDRLMQMYDDRDFVPLTRREIIRYVIAASRAPKTKDGANPREWAQRHLDQLRKKDPADVERVEQSFILGTGR